MNIACAAKIPKADCLSMLSVSTSALPAELHTAVKNVKDVAMPIAEKGLPPFLHIASLPDKKDEAHTGEVFRAKGAGIISAARAKKTKHLAVHTEGVPENMLRAFLEGMIIGHYSFDRYLAKKADRLEKLTIVSANKKVAAMVKEIEHIADSVHFVRDLVNTPAGDMMPQNIAAHAKKFKKPLSVSVIKGADLKKKGFAALHAVGKASNTDTQLLIVKYTAKKAKKTVALLGKGVTFDTGGLNIKVGNSISDMKFDMAGCATVLGVMRLLQHFSLPFNVIGVTPLAENMIDGGALRPGDVIDSYSGQTIEVTNTDAEGRLILCDALAYTEKELKPDLMVDLATLTGACIAAFGHEITAVVGNNQWLIDELKKASKQTEEKLWQLPLDERLRKKVKGTISDLKNYTSGVGAGTIMGAAYLSYFVKNTPWAHLDIAGSAWSTEKRGLVGKGATGQNVRLLWQFLQNLAEKKEWK